MEPVLDIDKQPKWSNTLEQPEPEEQDYAPGEAPERAKAKPKQPPPPKAQKPKPAPKKKPKPTKSELFERDLEAAIAKAKGGTRQDYLIAIEQTIQKHASPPAIHKADTLDKAQEFRTFEYKDWQWHYVAGNFSSLGAATKTVDNLRSFKGTTGKGIPERLLKATRSMRFTNQENNKDDHWRKVYKNFHYSKATGGRGEILAYRNNSLAIEDLTHESGHNLATKLYGATDPTIGYNDYDTMLKTTKEPPVSEYARNSPSEDFAESARVYVEDPDKMSKKFPDRYKVINRLMTDPTYGG